MSPRMRARSPLTHKKYAESLAIWLNFLETVGSSWDRATFDDAEGFKEWRMTDERNPERVMGSTFAANLAALRSFYRWASLAHGVTDPVSAVDDWDLAPTSRYRRKVKWLDPGGYQRWRDIGMRGLGLDGRTDPAWRGRNDQRDGAFVDGLYGSGLRLAEWSSVLVREVPGLSAGQGYTTCLLASACAKGGYGRKYWLPRVALAGALDYIEGARARAVRRAQAAGVYDRLKHRWLVIGEAGSQLELRSADAACRKARMDLLSPDARLNLYREGPMGLEPMALWLNENGLPRPAHSWQHTFTQANVRIAQLGLRNFSATAHMLRHSCALRWYSIGKLIYQRRLGHLSDEETRDFRQQFGDTWHLVATYLGHRNPETTKMYYLEPFRSLDIELLLHHAHGANADSLIDALLADHPLVLRDPLRHER
ncbi:site-specific integrase [Mycobacteroides abscessus]